MEISQDAPCMRFYRDTIEKNVTRDNSHVLQQSPQTIYEINVTKFQQQTPPRPSKTVLNVNSYVPPYKQYNPHNLNNVLLKQKRKNEFLILI